MNLKSAYDAHYLVLKGNDEAIVGKHLHQGCLRNYVIKDLNETKGKALNGNVDSLQALDTKEMYEFFKGSLDWQKIYDGKRFLIFHWVN